MKYKVIKADSHLSLVLAVNTFLADGWRPQGGVCFISNGKCAQAMVHPNDPDVGPHRPRQEEEEHSVTVTEDSTEDATVYTCCNTGCDQTAVFCRHTQFAGDHYFCENCGPKEEDFDTQGDSYGFWSDVTQPK